MGVIQFLHKVYIRSIAGLIWMNEAIFFYPKLRKFYRAAFKDTPPQLILDIGANRGQSIHFFKNLWKGTTMHSFEPNPALFSKLTRIFREDKIILHELGLTDSSGKRIFFEHIFDETSSFEKPKQQSGYGRIKNLVLLTQAKKAIRRSYEVTVSTLDLFSQENGIEHADILKIDVEGHEAAVLKGASRFLQEHSARFIQLEVHFDDQYSGDFDHIHQLLSGFGYEECARIGHGFGNFYEIVYRVSEG